jgi:hypothetical protein
MAERITKSQIESSFNHYLHAMGKRHARAHNDVGGWGLDYNPTYGGYVVYEVSNEGGAQSHPLGSRRRSPSEFYDALWFATQSLEESRRESRESRDPRRRSRRSSYGRTRRAPRRDY